MNSKIKYSASIIVPAIAFSLWLAGLIAFTSELNNTKPTIPDKAVDAVVVLTGGSNRIDEGFTLLNKGLAKKLFISGVYRGVDTPQLLARWKDEDQNKLDCCVVLGFDAINTIQNAKESSKSLKEEGFNSIYLVTSNYHMKRALFEFQRRNPNLEIHPYPIIPKKLDMNSWWKDKANLFLIIREYSKYITVRIIDFLIK